MHMRARMLAFTGHDDDVDEWGEDDGEEGSGGAEDLIDLEIEESAPGKDAVSVMQFNHEACTAMHL